ncbi:MAG TPA: hypothetical protein VIM97_12980 [Actinomycetes bacterium]
MPVVDLPSPRRSSASPVSAARRVVKFFFLNFMFDQLTGEALVQF